jgi:hypothetical protein
MQVLTSIKLIDITNNQDALNEWVEQIGKTANEICKDPNCNRIKLKLSDSKQPTGFIMGSNDAGALSCLSWAIERYIDAISRQLNSMLRGF